MVCRGGDFAWCAAEATWQVSSGAPLCPLVPGMAASGVDLRLATARAARVGIRYREGAPDQKQGGAGPPFVWSELTWTLGPEAGRVEAPGSRSRVTRKEANTRQT